MKRSAPQPPSHRAATNADAARVFVAGTVVRLTRDGTVVLRLRDRREVPCRCSSLVDTGWLRTALAIAPVEAEGTIDANGEGGSIWCLFPGPEHANVVAPTLNLVAAERISLRCGKSSVTLEKDGSLDSRGRDVMTRGSRSTRISGGIVRIN
jgi:hypothetical protein